jgi:integrase
MCPGPCSRAAAAGGQSHGIHETVIRPGPHPEWYTDEFHRVSDRAEVRRIRLHESRHTACSLMEKAGVPVSVIAAWAGHYSGAFTMATYVHANPDDLAAGRDALSAIYRAGGP